MFRNLTTTWKDEITKRNMLMDGDAVKVNFLFPVRSGGELQPGSNAWVVTGSHTASGRPLLSNDMHLEWSIPGIWYMTHLQAPASMCPAFAAGRAGRCGSDRIADNHLHFDAGFHMEKFNDTNGQYLYGDM
jgi:penicillin amidase